jgi:hypothetical protein
MSAPSPDPAAWVAEQFPGWRAWASQTGRWWAIPAAAATTGVASAGSRPLFHASSAEALAARITEQEARRTEPPASWPGGPSRRRPGRSWRP